MAPLPRGKGWHWKKCGIEQVNNQTPQQGNQKEPRKSGNKTKKKNKVIGVQSGIKRKIPLKPEKN